MKRCFSLKRNKRFRYVYHKGKSLPAKPVVMIFVKNRMGKVQVGFSVSKKIGNSVKRNRVKRRLREAFRPMIPELIPGYDIIFIARDAANTAEFSALQSTMRYLLRKAGLFLDQQGANNAPRQKVQKNQKDANKKQS